MVVQLRQSHAARLSTKLRIWIMMCLPAPLYAAPKFIFVGKTPRPLVDSLPRLLSNARDGFAAMFNVYSGVYFRDSFWLAYARNGLELVAINPLVLVSTAVFVLALLGVMLTSGYHRVRPYWWRGAFWVMCLEA